MCVIASGQGASRSPPFKGRGRGWGLYIPSAEQVRDPTPGPSP